MIKQILTLVILCWVSYATAQYSNCYHYLTNKAHHVFFWKQDAKTALAIYEQREKIQPDLLAYDAFQVALAHAHLENYDKAFDYLKMAVRKGTTLKGIEEGGKGIYFTTSEKHWIQFKKEYPTLRQVFLKNFDVELYVEISEMLAIEQYLRTKIYMKDKNKTTAGYFVKKDSVNMRRLMEITKQQGFPTEAQVGPQANYKFFLLFLHGLTKNVWAYDFFKVQLKKAIFEGSISPDVYAQAIDRHLLSGKKQPIRYGTYNKSDKEFSPIEDPANIDKRRMDIGLLPLHENWEFKKGWTPPKGYVPIKAEDYLKCWE